MTEDTHRFTVSLLNAWVKCWRSLRPFVVSLHHFWYVVCGSWSYWTSPLMYPARPLVSSTLNLAGSRWSPDAGNDTVSLGWLNQLVELEDCSIRTYQYQSNWGRSDIASSIVIKFLAASPFPVITGVIELPWGSFISSLSTWGKVCDGWGSSGRTWPDYKQVRSWCAGYDAALALAANKKKRTLDWGVP